MDNIVDFKKHMKDTLPKDSRWVAVVISSDGDTFLEHDERLNPYEIMGILEFGKTVTMDSMKGE